MPAFEPRLILRMQAQRIPPPQNRQATIVVRVELWRVSEISQRPKNLVKRERKQQLLGKPT